MAEMSPYVPSEFSARATPTLIDREPVMEQIQEAIADESERTWVFFITAPGGIGKTRLLQEALRCCREEEELGSPLSSPVFAAEEPVDLYHAHTHSREGLARAIRSVLDPGPGYFENYVEQRSRLRRIKQDLSEVIAEVDYQRERMIRAFLSDYSKLARDFRLVLALDTVEAIVHEPDRVQQKMGLKQVWSGIRGWLTDDLVPQMSNTVLLIAGRPASIPFQDDLSQIPGVRFVPLELEPFREKDTLEYFEAVAAAAYEAEQKETAARIEAVPPETRRVIHRYTGGRPILLALLVDYLAVADRLLPAVQVTLEEAIEQTPDETSLRRMQRRLEQDIVRVFQETGRETDETLRALAWTPKGMDASLLARISGWSPQRAAKALERVRPLSFTKVRPDDRRVFLHDEVYDLFERYVLSRVTEERQTRINKAILAYYAEEVEEARRMIQQATDAETPIDAETLTDAYARLHSGQVEEVYYCLRDDAVEGYQTYYRYAEEAFQTNAPELDQLLRDELVRYVDKYAQQEQIDGLSRSEVEQDLALRLVKWPVLRGQWDEALNYVRELRDKIPDLFTAPLPGAELSLFEGWALIYQGESLEQAESVLRQVVRELVEILEPADEFQSWRMTIALAYAHNHLGYLYRNRGRFKKAVREYRHSLPYWRQLPALEAEHSNTLNNLAWACAEAGDFLSAKRYVHDALNMRKRLGRRYLIALSLNTLGLIETREGIPDRAKIHCERALNIFRDLEQQRGVGMASTALAEALRREAALPGLHSPSDAADLLRDAERHAREAMNIFLEEHKEPARLVEALLEQGCIYRDWALIRDRYEHPHDDSAEGLAKQGERTLRRAAREAGERYFHRQVDALVNLAWLRYYAGDEGAQDVIETEVFPLVSDYRVTTDGMPSLEAPIAFLWVQLGKAHTLLGQIEFDKYRQADELYQKTSNPGDQEIALDHLHNAVSEWTLALAYNHQFADDFRDLRRALDRIYENMRTLNADEMKTAYRAIEETVDQHTLDKPAALRTYLEKTFGGPGGRRG